MKKLNKFVEVRIEIPKDSNLKYEMEDGKLIMDRTYFSSMKSPFNYGSIPGTKAEDGDEEDVFVINDSPIFPTAHVKVRLLGKMIVVDKGEVDNKWISVIENDPYYKEINDLKDLPQHTLDCLKHFYENYKVLENKITIVEGFENFDGEKI